jgi:hypothetical protein
VLDTRIDSEFSERQRAHTATKGLGGVRHHGSCRSRSVKRTRE